MAGIRTPQPLTRAMAAGSGSDGLPMEEAAAGGVRRARATCSSELEAHYRDMQDIEFTIQRGKLYILQTRTGKRTAPAALKIAVDMAAEGLITQEEAVLRVDPASLDQLLHPTLDPKAERKVIAKGLPASPGAVSGKVVFSADHAERMAAAGESVILVRIETSPDDIHGMHAAKGILTSRGGMTSHAAVVARGMGKACVCGAGDLAISYAEKARHREGRRALAEGDVITLDGAEGTVMLGAVPTVDPQLSDDFATLMEWADASRRLKVRTNAETPLDARTAVKFGAEGIGLCRTEHMFFQPDRIVAMQEMILADDAEGRTQGAGQDPADAARRLRRAVRDHGRAAGHHPPARPAAARVPAARGATSWLRSPRPPGSTSSVVRRRLADLKESQPDAGPARLPAGHPVPRDLRDAGARHLRGRVRRSQAAHRPRRWCPRS